MLWLKSNGMGAVVLIAAAMLPGTVADTCGSVAGACGAGYVFTGRAGSACNDGTAACNVDTAEEGDHAVCCMVGPTFLRATVPSISRASHP